VIPFGQVASGGVQIVSTAQALVLGPLLRIERSDVVIELSLDCIHACLVSLHSGIETRGDFGLAGTGVDALDDGVGSHRRSLAASTTDHKANDEHAHKSDDRQNQLRA